jgi:hypothetical protein
MVRFLSVSLAVLAAALLGRYLLVTHDARILGSSPSCTLHSLTGLYCAGCGGTRAMFAFLRGDLAASWRLNPFFLILLTLVTALGFRGLLLWSFPGRFAGMRRWPFPLWGGILLLVSMLVFMVLRNLPWWPFHLLAPA